MDVDVSYDVRSWYQRERMPLPVDLVLPAVRQGLDIQAIADEYGVDEPAGLSTAEEEEHHAQTQ